MKCYDCQKTVPTKGFATFRTRTGEVRRRGICKECRGKYALENFERLKRWRKQYNQNNRNERGYKALRRRQAVKIVIDQIKSETPCSDCHRNFPAVAMDFDHVKGKNKGISSMASQGYKIDLVLEEIKLCEIVCACCHRIRTAKRKENHSIKSKHWRSP